MILSKRRSLCVFNAHLPFTLQLKDVSSALKEAEDLYKQFETPLKDVFMFFAAIPSSYEKEQLFRHQVREPRKYVANRRVEYFPSLAGL